MYKVISRCPVCNGKLHVVKLKCNDCNTIIENSFTLNKFDYLDKEQLSFLEVFVKCRGNIKDVEKEMGISYPTVRAKLDEVIISLGYSSNKKTGVSKDEILDMLDKGEITSEQAVNMLNE